MSFFEEKNPEMDRYLENHASSEPEILKKLRRETFQKTTQPHMISGYQQGRLLTIISKMVNPKNVLEIGTFTGYATLCLAEGLSSDGKITTLDVNEDLAYLPRKYFSESEFSNQIDFQIQDAKEFLRNTDEIFDLIFIDADKENYAEYFRLIKPKTKSGSVILFDNVLWYGKVLEENPKQKSTQIIKELNDLAAKDEDFENLILPLRDGVNFLRRK
ncbi:O-methyltransferase [Chryseobacterium indoltheticum]|uniref:O-methyltransferase MSMEG_5073 n=1 Tax=Chryseobacterium indoltheticum TaxID=254 RepID=A0A381JQW3_9FLAO|nr:O-methyltransferase [Chryseobacterium indoltheticum]AZA75707.1 O-methyltransferase [Chryseobacterium indoltheticum]SIQ48332.1 Predicted O-methyltransferase YrrM [Chryseobacterium indoltheticum]SUY53842.1 Putative O-methyltransferase MSMEG_5073 [Chryseobacterium indoltheticum]